MDAGNKPIVLRTRECLTGLGVGYAEEKAIEEEDRRQVAKWGYQCVTPYEWLCYLTEEVGELAEAINKTYSDHDKSGADDVDIYKEAIQVATLAVKIAKMHRSNIVIA